ncbi:unnamed protein product [Lymnaea stagnalis]|uniref:Exosome complex component 10 homolog n=1 Tax=Lymnaea stagnalis TaxID=6523 RepID=A0AAV2H9Z5_LYMST
MEEEEQEKLSTAFFGYADINDFSQKSLRAVLKATKSSNDLPVGDDFDFYSTFRSVRDVLDIEGGRILSLLQRLLRHQNVKGNLIHGDLVEMEDKFDILMDANDQILEKAGTLLDEASGLGKEEKTLVMATATASRAASSWNKKSQESNKPAVAYRLMTARNIQRPQLSFQDKIDNSNFPFKPQLRQKPNALKSLEESLKLPEGVSLEETENPMFVYPHPYMFELDAFKPKETVFQQVVPKEPQSLDSTPLTMVETKDRFLEMLQHLRAQTEIAVDLEHHSYRTFQGFTCLMQISTRSRDYIIDTLALRSHIHLINEIFTDPNITKVFHGADSDIGWLQRDFGVYVVNMFDTGQAARVLGFSRFSLAHLLMSYCRVEADKQFQLADWRIRPLPSELINYAREDTHYLLYIFDMMKNQLIDRGNVQNNLLMSVFERSRTVAAKVYQKPVFTQQDYMELYKKSRKSFNNQQLAALQEIYEWRDSMARLEDESIGYVLPNHMMLQIAEILPRERQGVLACCNPIPPLVRQSLIELHHMVLQARDLTPSKTEKPSNVQQQQTNLTLFGPETSLTCPHDMSHIESWKTNIEQQISETGLVAHTASMFNLSSVITKTLPVISAFTAKPMKSKTSTEKLVATLKSSFLNPFVRYLPKDSEGIIRARTDDLWRLKASTVPPQNLKRKTDIKQEEDLDSFQPVFVLPQKKPKIKIHTKDSEVPTKTSSSIFSIPEKEVSQTGTSGKRPLKKLEQQVEKKIKSLRQEVTFKKNKEKKKKAVKEKKEKILAENAAPETDVVNANTSEKTKNVAENGNKNISGSTALKKKKGKKPTISDVAQSFEAFDYATAEASLRKDNKQKKKSDVYNPSLPSRSGKSKDQARKPKLACAKSNKSVSFGLAGKKGKKA